MQTIKKVSKTLLIFLLLAQIQACIDRSKSVVSDKQLVPALDLSNIDSTVNPADDFFKFVNGNWLKKTEIPADQGRWGSFNELRENTNDNVFDVLKKAAESNIYKQGSDQWKAAEFFASGMDSMLSKETGIKPLLPHFEKIKSIDGTGSLRQYLVSQQKLGGGAFFGFSIFPDLMNSKVNAPYISQGGLGLPDRDYYTKTDERSVEIREKYLLHVQKMLTMIENTEEVAKQKSQKIMQLETQLAKASMTRVEQRNIPALYNKMSLEDLHNISPSFDWQEYFSGLGVSSIDTIIVTQPKFVGEFEKVINNTPIEDWQTYLEWQLINGAANFLSDEYQQANFDFYSKELRGLEAMRPRWKRVLGVTNGFIGEAIGKLYVEAVFPPEAKATAQEMVKNIIEAYEVRIAALDWMNDSTKQKAIEKLNTLTIKIGYPDEWKDYTSLEIGGGPENGSYIQNVMNAASFTFQQEIEKYGKPVDKDEWGMSPQTVNAYYNPLFNEIVFPAAILQPPFYNYQADAAVNYGGIGAVIGHEISHGFDDQGSRFDSEGNMKNWWEEKDLENFKTRTVKLENQFNEYEPLKDVNVNGALTLGENIGDLGGISAAYDGLQKHLQEVSNPGKIDGLTPEQRFFISWATIWRIKYRDETLRTQINTDPHSPGMYRANGPISNLETFYTAFNVQEGDGMFRPDSLRVKIW
ncbi:MAG: M13 family metallopeptidase [Bacteroidota bacterium]